jgi:hypothetical protein
MTEIYKTIIYETIKRKMRTVIKNDKEKNPNMKFDCPIPGCGGHFIRQKKSVHEKTNRHLKAVKIIKTKAKTIIKELELD